MEEEHRRGPWTVEEDLVLVKFVTEHGEGRWNALARCAGLKRTGKSCRLRWLNYLRPDVRRGNITPDEQLLILELHSRWGNRWSKIARFLPGRTDNEIKNYWRTRVQKHAKQLGCDVNSKTFRDAMRHLWMPRLLEQARAAASAGGAPPAASSCFFNPIATAADPPPPYSAGKQPEQAVAPWPAETMAGPSSSSEDSAPPAQLSSTLAAGCYPAAAMGMVKRDEEFLDMDGGWTSSSESLPACPMNYGEFEQLGGWASEDLLLSSEYLWNMAEEALDQSYIC